MESLGAGSGLPQIGLHVGILKLLEALTSAAKQAFPIQHYQPTRPWITDELARRVHHAKPLKLSNDPDYTSYYKAIPGRHQSHPLPSGIKYAARKLASGSADTG